MNLWRKSRHHDERGQILVIVAVGMVVIIAMVGIVIDGGYAWGKQRETQNGADSASEAGAAVLAWNLAYTSRGLTAPKGDGDVLAAVNAAGQANDIGDPDDPLWIDHDAQRQVRPRIPVRLEVLERPVLREELLDHPDLVRTEILRVPRIGNPAALTPQEWAAVLALVEEAPGNSPMVVV